MDGKFKEVKLPPQVEAKLKELLAEGLLGGPTAQDLGSPDIPAEFTRAAEQVKNLSEYICNTFPHDGAPDREKLPKGVELLMRLIESAATPGSMRGQAVEIAKGYSREELQEFVNVSAVMSQIIVQTLRHLEYSLGDGFPAFTVTEGMVTPLLAANKSEDGDCNCVNCKARREGKAPPVDLAALLQDAQVTVLAMDENDNAFTGDSGPIKDIADALRGGKGKPPVS